MVDGLVSGHDPAYGLLSLQLPGSTINLRLPHGPLPLGQSVRIKVKARDVSLSLQQAEDSSVLNLLPARVVDWINVAEQAHVLVRVQVGGEQLIARITRYSFDRLQIQREQSLWAQVKSVSLLSTH